MAVKVKAKEGKTVAGTLADYQAKLGDSIGSKGGKLILAERVPTGLFPLDLAIGGGFPRGQCSIVYGPEDSAKTSVVLSAIANHQRMWPELKCVYVAIEPYNRDWAKKLGVDVDNLYVLNPLFAEEAADMVGDMLEAEDVGMVALDSIAAMITTQEAAKSAEGFNPGSSAQAVGKLVRRSALALRKGEQEGRLPTVIYINQTRFKIGVMFGNPEIMSGGNAPLFQSQLTLRFYGKAIKDTKISDKFPIAREISFAVKKFKVPISADNGTATMVTYPHKGLNIGDTDDINTITTYLKEFGAMEKTKKGWEVLGEEYPTIAAFTQRVYMDHDFGMEVRNAIISRVMEEFDISQIPEVEIEVDADGVITEKVPE